MVIEGFLQASDLNIPMPFAEDKVDYSKVGAFKEKIFNAAYRRFQKRTDREEFDRFVHDQDYWLEDFALFTVIKSVHGGPCWNEWPKALKTRQPQALEGICPQECFGPGEGQVYPVYIFPPVA